MARRSGHLLQNESGYGTFNADNQEDSISIQGDDHDVDPDLGKKQEKICCSHFEVTIHGLTALAIIALVGASVRCTILAIFTANNFSNPCSGCNSTQTHVFDLIHSVIQSMHVLEYFTLLYGIGGFYLYVLTERNTFHKLNGVFKETCKRLMCRFSITCIGTVILGGIGLVVLATTALVPVIFLTKWRADIVTESSTLTLTKMYVGISYLSHTCHSVTRIFMVCVTLVIRSAWLYHTPPLLKAYHSNTSAIAWARAILSPKWLEHELEDEDGPMEDSQQRFTKLIKEYNKTGRFVTALHGIFQQWFVMQWVVYFIKIIEDFSVTLDSLVTTTYTGRDIHQLMFVLTHLVFDLVLFLIPYFCASLFNEYHLRYHERLRKIQTNILSKDAESWMLQCSQLIPENPKYVFIPSICGLGIPLSSPGYNMSIIFAFFAFIISLITTL